MDPSAGDIIDEEMGDTRVKQETISVAAHLRLMLQFLGLALSAGPSQVTCKGVSDSYDCEYISTNIPNWDP